MTVTVTLHAYDVATGRRGPAVTASGDTVTADADWLAGLARQYGPRRHKSAEAGLRDLEGWSNGRLVLSASPPKTPGWLRGSQP